MLLYYSLLSAVPCAVELRDDSDKGTGNISYELIKHGLVTATEQVKCGLTSKT